MKAPGNNFDRVSVVRQTYDPNGPLSETFLKLTVPKDDSSPDLLIRGTDELLLEETDFQRKDVSLQFGKAERYLELEANTPLFLEGTIKARAKARGELVEALYLLMTPRNTLEYRRVREALDFIETGRRTRTPGYEDGVLYAEISGEFLPPRSELQERIHDLGRTASRQVYQVIPGDLRKKEVPRASRKLVESPADGPEATEYPEPRAS